jgi:hypothetical protein
MFLLQKRPPLPGEMISTDVNWGKKIGKGGIGKGRTQERVGKMEEKNKLALYKSIK